MVSAGSKAPADSAGHRKFWSFFHLKQNHTVKSFLLFSHLSMAKEPLSSGLIFNTLQSLMLPKANETKDKQTEKTASQVNGPGPSCFLGLLCWGSKEKVISQ